MSSSTSTGAPGSCVTIGNFDGVHLGHQALIKKARDIAADKNLNFALMTFWPHPRLIVPGHAGHLYLTGQEERLRLLKALGVPKVLEIPFTADLAAMSARDFIKEFLLPLNPRSLVIGHDFTLGHNREGNVQSLNSLGKEYGFEIEQLPPLLHDGLPVSSTRLRKLIEEGDVTAAALLLGRPYALEGTVIHGFGRGATLGFPTANMEVGKRLLPGMGVYAAIAQIDGKTCPAVVSIGRNPTFNGGEISVESFLLDCTENLYGKNLRLEFIQRLRGQCKFPNAEALVARIQLDVLAACECLNPYMQK